MCPFTTSRQVDEDFVRWPAAVAHAKQMGGTLTACGQNSSTWARLFHVTFPAPQVENCPVCLSVLESEGTLSPRSPRPRQRSR